MGRTVGEVSLRRDMTFPHLNVGRELKTQAGCVRDSRRKRCCRLATSELDAIRKHAHSSACIERKGRRTCAAPEGPAAQRPRAATPLSILPVLAKPKEAGCRRASMLSADRSPRKVLNLASTAYGAGILITQKNLLQLIQNCSC